MTNTVPSRASHSAAAPTPPVTAAVPPARSAARVDRAYLVMLVPAVVLFTVFLVLPAIIGVFYSFTNYAGYGSWEFIGLGNYAAMLNDPDIFNSYVFTFFIAIVTVIVVNAVALALAVGLNSKIKWRTTLRTIFFIPMVLSAIVIAYVFNYLFSTTLPAFLEALGLTSTGNSLLASERWAWVAVVIVASWQSIPGATIIYLAGLQAIPGDVYEAAQLDGSTGWRTFRSITMPLLAGYVLINIVLGFKGYLGIYEIVLALTNGGPGKVTTSVALQIFSGFKGGDYSYQIANAVVFFVITVVISLAQLAIVQRRGVTL